MSTSLSALSSELSEYVTSLNPSAQNLLDLYLQDNPIWTPQKGPQTDAWLSPADELFFGGQAGGGKSELILGLSLTAHKRSVIFRRNFTQFRGGEGLIQRAYNVIGKRGHFSSRINGFLLNDGRTVEFGGLEDLTALSKWRGRPHDGLFFDELAEFNEQMYLFLIGWLRTTDPTQRTRVIGAGNPPASVEGEWVIRRWRPWLDGQHSNPAAPGDLRWFVRLDDKDTEVESDKPVVFKGETLTPKSRTFIPASLSDNPYLARTGYNAQLQGLPEPLRSQLLYGDFSIGIKDDPWQAIPTQWVEAAMRRWTDQRPEGPATMSGLDVARGGSAKTVLSERVGAWFAPLIRLPGKDTPDSAEGVRLVSESVLRGAVVNVDVGGPGAAVVDMARQVVPYERVAAINFGSGTKRRDRTNLLRFTNLRALMYWSLREALDPEKGDGIALPPDPELKADLCAVKYGLRVNGIQMEDKDDIAEVLGRSPDAGDAVALCALPQQPVVAFY
jgi:hypothetical protein